MATYITRRGDEALESAMSENQDYSKALVSFKSGTSFKVRIPEGAISAEYKAHSVYKCFYTTPCTGDDLYDKATDILYKEKKRLEEAGDQKMAEEIGKLAGMIRAKERYLIAFFNLETGEPFLIDLTKNQAKDIGAKLKKYRDKKDKFAFELSKSGTSTDTKVDLDIIIDDLDPSLQKTFDSLAGKEIDQEVFGKVLPIRDRQGQIDDIKAFADVVKKKTGFDLLAKMNLGDLGTTETSGNDAEKVNGAQGKDVDLDF